MRSWRIRGIGSDTAAVPDQRGLPVVAGEPNSHAAAEESSVISQESDLRAPASRRPSELATARSATTGRHARPVKQRSIGPLVPQSSSAPAQPSEAAAQPSEVAAQSSGPAAQPSDVSAQRPGVAEGQRPRHASPFADAVRGVPPCPLRVRQAPDCVDLDRVLSEVREIAMWAGNDGRVQDTGRFLLLDGDRVWHSVAFGDAQGSELIKRMRAIPGFDTNVLLDAVSARSGQLEPLWPPRAVAAAKR